MKQVFCIVLSFLTPLLYAQITFPLSEELEEISGIEQLDENTFIAINDGGNKPTLYFLSKDGQITKRVRISNATNVDWEDLTRDENYLYIGDIGNNLNKRKNLCVYKVKIKDAIELTEVLAEKIEFCYFDQTEFPPSKKDRNFDAEAMVIKNDSVYIFSKNSTDPWNGISKVYGFSTKVNPNQLSVIHHVYIGPDNWWADAVTAADYFDGKWYLLTYNRIIQLVYTKKGFESKEILKFETTTQTESIKVIDHSTIIVADEKQRILGGGKLYEYKVKL